MLHIKRNFWGKKPGFDSGDILHVGINVLFVAIVYSLAYQWNLIAAAVILMILSKWRIFAVQPRFWLPNLKTNLVDITVGLGSVALIAQTKNSWLALAIALQYALWLLLIKPRSTSGWVAVQSLYSIMIGLITVFNSLSLLSLPMVAIVLIWLINWSSARHFFASYEEPNFRLFSLVWAALASHMLWFSLHFIQYYHLFDLKISVAVLLLGVTAATIGSLYRAYKTEKLNKSVAWENGLVGGVLVVLLFLKFL